MSVDGEINILSVEDEMFIDESVELLITYGIVSKKIYVHTLRNAFNISSQDREFGHNIVNDIEYLSNLLKLRYMKYGRRRNHSEIKISN